MFQCKSSKNVKALGFCVDSTFAISPPSEFLEVLWDSDAHFSSYKGVIWQLYVFYAYLSYKKRLIQKILYFRHSVDIIRSQ